MEEDEIELIDYLRVIWKRKILIIVGTLVCLIAGVTVSLRLPEIYHAEVLMRIGKVNTGSVSSSSSPPPFALLDTIENLVEIIPVEYALEDEEALEYDLNVEVVKGTSLMKIVLKGPERKAKELLNEVVEEITTDHLRKTESSVRFYKVLIEKRETDIKEIQNDLVRETLELEEMNKEMNKEMNVEVDINETDPSTLMMIQNRSLAIQNNILRMKQIAQYNQRQSRIAIKSFQDDILLHQLTISSLKENKTKLIGEVESITIKPKRKRNVILTGVVGLMMSLFLAFFIEYLGKVREKG